MAGEIQDDNIKSAAELVSGGGTAAQLPNDTKIYVTALGLNKTLNAAITAGDFASGVSKVRAIYETNAGTAYGAAVTILNYEDMVLDTDSAVTTGASWKFTCPRAGDVKISASCFFQSDTYASGDHIDLYVYKNGSLHRPIGSVKMQASITDTFGVFSSQIIVPGCIIGDYLDVRVYNGAGGIALSTDAKYNYVMIEMD